MQATSTSEPPELAQLKDAMGVSFRGMDRAFACIDQAMGELGRAKSDCQEAQGRLAAIFNGSGPRAGLGASAYRSVVLENQDPVFLKQVLVDAWRKSDWAFMAIQKLAAGASPDEIPGLPT